MNKDLLSRRLLTLLLPPLDSAVFCLIDLRQLRENEVVIAKKYLDKPTINRANRFIFSKDTQRFIITHALLRIFLEQTMHVPLTEIIVSYTEQGKPYLKHQTYQFNISYTNNYAFIGIHPFFSIGVDIEYIHDSPKLLEACKLVLSSEEQALIFSSTNPLERFYSVWCAKEALLKALGCGFLTSSIPSLQNEDSGNQNYEKFLSLGMQIYVFNNKPVNHKLAVCILPH